MVHFGKEKVIRNLLPFCIKTISARNGQFFFYFINKILTDKICHVTSFTE